MQRRLTLSRALPGLALLAACPAQAQDIATLQGQRADPVSGLAALPFEYRDRTRIPPVLSSPGPPGRSREPGAGDFTYEGFFTPAQRPRDGWIWGVGPVLSFETAADGVLGQGRYGAGPVAVVVRAPDTWTYGALLTQSRSFEGNAEQASVRTFQLQRSPATT